MSFADLKKASKGSADRLAKEIEKLTQKANFDDNRFWYPKRDKVGNGSAIIRLLPAVNGEDIPWIRFWHHGFEQNGKWYIENCPTTIGGKCPCCAANSVLWDSGVESNKEIVRKRKRKLTYVSNVLVIKDPETPENNGKVFLYKYGKKIMDKIESLMHPDEKLGEKAIDPFNFWEGADFKLRIREYEGYANYDKSEFDKPAPLFGGDDKKLEVVYTEQHKLQEFVAADKFKSEEDLNKRLAFVLGSKSNNAPKAADDNTGEVFDTSGVEETGGIDYFQRLANNQE